MKHGNFYGKGRFNLGNDKKKSEPRKKKNLKKSQKKNIMTKISENGNANAIGNEIIMKMRNLNAFGLCYLCCVLSILI